MLRAYSFSDISTFSIVRNVKEWYKQSKLNDKVSQRISFVFQGI